LGLRLGEVPPEGRAICLYLSGAEAPSPAGRIGMPSGGGDGSSYIDMMAEIGGALKVVDKEEHRLTGKKPMVNLLIRRWFNYMSMVKHRNALKTAKKLARLALKEVQVGGSLDELQKWEEAILREQAAYDKCARNNDRLRRRSLYLQLMGVFREELQSRGVRT
jgi:hypothetical protein